MTSIQQNVERLYRDGQPLHHQDSAAAIEYDPTSETSNFFVTTAEAFDKLDGEQVQAIFRDRNILIPGPAPKDFHFDSQGLGALGSLTTQRQIQGICHIPRKQSSRFSHVAVGSLRLNSGEHPMLRVGTLQDFLITDKQGKRRILNALDLPMGGATVPMPPQYRCVMSAPVRLITYLTLCRHFASNEQAWWEMRDVEGLVPDAKFPSDDTLWATAATQNATTWNHIDDHGMGTIIQVMAGYKYWVILRPKHDQGSALVDMGSINAFNDESWMADDVGNAFWEYEGVLLGPGDTLCVNFLFLIIPPDQF